jgi:hypothetical protein
VKLDEAILEEIKRAGPGSRPELIRRMAGRMTPALDRLIEGGLLYKVSNRPDRPVSEKVYSLSPDPIDWSRSGPAFPHGRNIA